MSKPEKNKSLEELGLQAQIMFAHCFRCKESTEHHKPVLAHHFRCCHCGDFLLKQSPATLG